MLKERLNIISEVINSFQKSEPSNEQERYVLSSMWVMAVGEFEGSVKNLTENYLDFLKNNKKNEELNISLLLKIHYPKKTKFTKLEIEELYTKSIKDIDFDKIIDPKKPRNKSQSLSDLFEDIGIKFKKEDYTAISQ